MEVGYVKRPMEIFNPTFISVVKKIQWFSLTKVLLFLFQEITTGSLILQLGWKYLI